MNSARALLATALLGLLLMTGSALAHDIDVTGVARLILDESPDENAASASDAALYRLSIIDAKVPPLFNVAQSIPRRCETLEPGLGSYRFRCSPRLSREDSLLFPWSLAGVVLIGNWQDGSSQSSYFRGDGVFVETPLAEIRAPSAGMVRLAGQYLVLGVDHIVFGIDHLLFIVGLLLLLSSPVQSANPARLRYVKTITAFTVAHSLTLGAAVLGVVTLPTAPIELLIALSLVLLAREAIMAQRGNYSLSSRSPWLVAFAFGLVHGLGFASALGDLGLHPSDIPSALLFFNIGVEAGQLAIVTITLGAFALTDLGLKRLNPMHAQQLVAKTTASSATLLGGVALFWCVERLPSLWS